MKRLLTIFFMLLIGVGIIQLAKYRLNTALSEHVQIPTPSAAITPLPPAATETISLFVPYWAVTKTIPTADYSKIIYFGISPTTHGIETTEAGYLALPRFVSAIPRHVPTYLTLRMLDEQTNFAILENPVQQQQVIAETVRVAKQYGFSGIVLDLELRALPFDSVMTQITSFTKEFARQTHTAEMSFALTMYGDAFYRIRPFDVKAVGTLADEVFIMAYDFHKAKGNPGPNFPLAGKATYGYDVQVMLTDYLHVIPGTKLTILFGLFGYDWTMDKQKTDSATALTLQQITNRFISACQARTCHVSRDTVSAETKITYTANDGEEHTVWFEDFTSVARKKQFFKTQGIGSFSYWAYSYF